MTYKSKTMQISPHNPFKLIKFHWSLSLHHQYKYNLKSKPILLKYKYYQYLCCNSLRLLEAKFIYTCQNESVVQNPKKAFAIEVSVTKPIHNLYTWLQSTFYHPTNVSTINLQPPQFLANLPIATYFASCSHLNSSIYCVTNQVIFLRLQLSYPKSHY